MKTYLSFLFLFILIINLDLSYSQSCQDCDCGTTSSGEEDLDSLIGGRYKPAVTNTGGAQTNFDNFPVLIVFVQFQNEPYSYSTHPDAWNSGQPPNYMDSLISDVRLSSSNWWNSYNGYAVSDYWHEFSRGKLHITGRAISIILPHNIEWYDTTGRGIAKSTKIFMIH